MVEELFHQALIQLERDEKNNGSIFINLKRLSGKLFIIVNNNH